LSPDPTGVLGVLAELGKPVETGLSPLATGWEDPEAALKERFRWVRGALDRNGPAFAKIGDNLLNSILLEAEALGLTVLEMLARDLRAILRARYFKRWEAALEDADVAANLAARLVALHANSEVERSLRLTLLPIFDRALELLAEGALETANEPHPVERERVGRALLDYVEQMANLALSEALRQIRSGGAIGLPVIGQSAYPQKSEDLQAPFREGEGVLQYFLVGPYLLVFAYGRDFFTWDAQALAPEDPEGREPLPIRTYLTPFLATWRAEQRAERRARGLRNLFTAQLAKDDEHQKVEGMSTAECLCRITEALLPAPVAATLEHHRVRRLAIVPHDILYRVPFGSLPWCQGRLGERFSLSLQPTGALAGRHPSRSRRTARPRLGFFVGPGLRYADAEHQALSAALRRGAKIIPVDTAVKGQEAFVQEAPGCDVLYLACHGHAVTETPNESDSRNLQEARLGLGPPGSFFGLAETAALNLHRCGLVVLQSCWTGWMNHLRESPVQGFPHALRDAGAGAVVAPMFPVDDPLCPVFAAVFGRELRFRAVGEALTASLRILRRYGDALLPAGTEAARFRGIPSVFDAYEYRLTGNPNVRIHGGWVSRLAARVDLAIWLARPVGAHFYRRLGAT
jgi:hypothetical protein